MTVAEKLVNLAELYRQGLDSRFLDRQLDKLLQREALECRHQIAQLEARLAVLERQYGECTEDFWRRWQAGQVQDSFDFTGQELRRFAGFTGSVYGIDFAPDGRVIAMNSLDGTMWLSYLDINDTVDSLCSQLLRDLTDEERAQYGVSEGATCPLHLDR